MSVQIKPLKVGNRRNNGRRRVALAGLLTATTVSIAANAMVVVLLPWLVLTRTGSAAQAGLVGAVSLAAGVAALFLGGPLIDRWGRRRVAAAADLLSAAAVAALPVLDATVGLTLVGILALTAVGAVFDGPGAAAREAARPDVAVEAGVGLSRVNARGEAAEGVGGILGPALAGAGLGVLGATTSLWVAAAMFVLAAAATWWALPPDRSATPAPEPYLRAAAAGLRLVWHDRTLRAVTLLGALGYLAVAPLTLVLTAHLAPAGQAGWLGAVLGAFAGGGVLGALAYGWLGDRWSRRGVLVVALAGAGAGLATMALLPPPPVLAALAGVVGLLVGPVNPVLAALMQQRTPAHLLGRVVSTTWSLTLLASPLGVLLAGLLLEAAGPTVTLLAVAGAVLATTAYAALTPGLKATAGVGSLP